MAEIRTVKTEPEDVGEAKAEVERNRERLSETLDAIEDRIVETKSALRDRVNVLRPVQDQVRARPWFAVAAAVGAGAALGVLAGGDSGPSVIDEDERRRRREWRRRRKQRMHGGDSQAKGGQTIRAEARKRGSKRSRSNAGTMRAMRNQLMGMLTTAITRGLRQRILDSRGKSRPAAGRPDTSERVVHRGYEGGDGQSSASAHHGAGMR
jgi:ElaB/YqjD/DUF883 family membrane-anchored ribosome-binding protein